jgi:hypothetical protein
MEKPRLTEVGSLAKVTLPAGGNAGMMEKDHQYTSLYHLWIRVQEPGPDPVF